MADPSLPPTGLRSLELWQEIDGVFQPPLNQPIALQHLSLTAEYSLPESALQALLESAPNLTRLDLHCGGATYNHSWLQRHNPLTILGPRLRHLSLHNPPPPQAESQAGLSFSLSAALPTCTSLISLEVSNATDEQLVDIFRLLPCQLELLETAMARGDHPFLVKVTALPALASLKKWRMRGFVESRDGEEQWVTLSRARGVHVRDERRFFTGESSSRRLLPSRGMTNLSLVLLRQIAATSDGELTFAERDVQPSESRS